MKMHSAPAGKFVQLAGRWQTHVRRNVQLDTRCQAEMPPERSIDRRLGLGLRLQRVKRCARSLPECTFDLVERSTGFLERLDPQELIEMFRSVMIAASQAVWRWKQSFLNVIPDGPS